MCHQPAQLLSVAEHFETKTEKRIVLFVWFCHHYADVKIYLLTSPVKVQCLWSMFGIYVKLYYLIWYCLFVVVRTALDNMPPLSLTADSKEKPAVVSDQMMDQVFTFLRNLAEWVFLYCARASAGSARCRAVTRIIIVACVVCVCLSVHHDGISCKNWWMDWDATWKEDL